VLARRAGPLWRRGDERSDAAPGLEDPGPFQLGIHPRDRVGVHFQFDGELADGRQLVARLQPAGRDGRPQPAFELRVDRRLVADVDGDHTH
jgi:hypothetical protein